MEVVGGFLAKILVEVMGGLVGGGVWLTWKMLTTGPLSILELNGSQW